MAANTIESESIRNDEHCFCCGKKNEKGLQLDFVYLVSFGSGAVQ